MVEQSGVNRYPHISTHFLLIAYVLSKGYLSQKGPMSDFYLPLFRCSSLLRWSVTDSYLLALTRLHNHPGHTSNNNRRDIDPLPVHVFLPLRGSSNTNLTAVTTERIQERVQIEVNGQHGLMLKCPLKTQHAMLVEIL